MVNLNMMFTRIIEVMRMDANTCGRALVYFEVRSVHGEVRTMYAEPRLMGLIVRAINEGGVYYTRVNVIGDGKGEVTRIDF